MLNFYIFQFFIYIKRNNNADLIIKYFILGGILVLLLSYLKYFELLNLNSIYEYYNMNLVGAISRAPVFQTSIIHGSVFSFIAYLSIFRAKNNNNKWLYLLSILCMINIFFMNDSRNSYIISLLLIFLILYYQFYKIKYLVTTLSLLLAFTLFLTPLAKNLTQSVYDTKNDINLLFNENYTSSIGLRTLWISIGVQNIKSEPILGHGVGSYKNLVKEFINKNEIDVRHNLAISNNPHNEFISISSQLGLFGLILYILFLYSLFKESNKKFLALGVFTIISVSSFFNSALYDNVFGLFIIIILSLVYQDKFLE